jgi:hypothetical protein
MTTIGIAGLDMFTLQEESSRRGQNHRRRVHLLQHRRHQIPASRTSPSFADHTVAFLVSF